MTNLAHLHLVRGVDCILATLGDGPGATIGVVQDGELAVHRCRGMSSLELGVPIGPDTTFRIASVTKQFTCAAILMLAADGLLRLDDDARTHLPELPGMGAPVTVAHLMHNTSGIRDMLGIMRQGGADLGQPVRPDELMAGILRQRTLNFTPGSRFLYSNSNFLLLGRIVERVSGERLADLLHRRVFTPAGMTRTRLVETVDEVVPGLATCYVRPADTWTRARHAFPLHGEGGMVSGVEDLALWSRWLDANPGLADTLATQAPFTNGHPSLYARGQVVRDYRGVRTVGHGGLWPGYRTEFLRVPAEGITIVAITNRGDADPSVLAHQVLDLMLDGRPGAPPTPARASPADVQPLVGRWLDKEAFITLDIEVTGNGAVNVASFGLPFLPSVLPDGRLGAVRGMTSIALRRLENDAIEVEQDAGHLATYRRVPPGASLPVGLAGAYFSPEMDTAWHMSVDAGVAQVTATGPIVPSGPWPVEAVESDVIRIHTPDVLMPTWLDVRVDRDAAGTVLGLEVNSGRVRRAYYHRQPGV